MQKVAELLNVIGTIGECFWIYCIIDILFERRVITKRFLKNKWGVILSNIIFAALIILIMNQQVLTSPLDNDSMGFLCCDICVCFLENRVIECNGGCRNVLPRNTCSGDCGNFTYRRIWRERIN